MFLIQHPKSNFRLGGSTVGGEAASWWLQSAALVKQRFVAAVVGGISLLHRSRKADKAAFSKWGVFRLS